MKSKECFSFKLLTSVSSLIVFSYFVIEKLPTKLTNLKIRLNKGNIISIEGKVAFKFFW